MSDVKFWDGNAWIDPCDKEVNIWTGNEWKTLKNGDAIWTGTEWKGIVCNTVFKPFDFAVVRYRWLGAAGNDLDTRTSLSNVPGAGSEVGYNTGFTRVPDNGVAFIQWGGDNTSQDGGVEAILINFEAIILANPTLTEIRIALKAHWHGTKKTGDIKLEFQTYLGGEMTGPTIAKDFENSGGAEAQKEVVDTTVTHARAVDAIYDDLGILVYNVASKTASFV